MKLSIITINYNNTEGLRKTLTSVASQTFRDFEHIIVDGESTDGSVEIIRQYADNEALRLEGDKAIRQENSNADNLASSPNYLITLPSILWISEPDKGIYNAMNKGIEIALGKRTVNSFNRSELVEDKNKGIHLANGTYVLFLNSGDTLAETTTLQQMVDCNLSADICYFDAEFTYNGKSHVQRTYPDQLSLRFFLRDSLCHQAILYRLDTLRTIGGYDEQYKLIGDWALNVKAIILNNCSFQHYSLITTYYEIGGLSWTKEGRQRCEEEKRIFLQNNLPTRVYDDFLYWESIENSDWYRRVVRIKSSRLQKILLYWVKLLNKLDR